MIAASFIMSYLVIMIENGYISAIYLLLLKRPRLVGVSSVVLFHKAIAENRDLIRELNYNKISNNDEQQISCTFRRDLIFAPLQRDWST